MVKINLTKIMIEEIPQTILETRDWKKQIPLLYKFQDERRLELRINLDNNCDETQKYTSCVNE